MQQVSLVNLLKDAGTGESAAMLEARRTMEVCNACRYCEGYCAVFPAMTLYKEFASGDLTYLANLCHDCKGCFHACQYAPPHEFGINVPKVFAEVREESYAVHSWPRFAAITFGRNALTVLLTTIAALCAIAIPAAALKGSALFQSHVDSPGRGFYEVISHTSMTTASIVFLYAVFALILGLARFWRTIEPHADSHRKANVRAILRGLRDAATLRYLRGGGHGCNDVDESFSNRRRYFHHSLAYGFLLCFAATATATVYDHVLGWHAPYAFFSMPVLLGTIGGTGMMVGASGLLWLKLTSDRAPQSRSQTEAGTVLLVLLLMIAATGLLLLAVRSTSLMGTALILHLSLVLALFVVMPYSHFVHGLYRSVALTRHAFERMRAAERGSATIEETIATQ
jgi:citrate/tricarballylate utilization protein